LRADRPGAGDPAVHGALPPAPWSQPPPPIDGRIQSPVETRPPLQGAGLLSASTRRWRIVAGDRGGQETIAAALQRRQEDPAGARLGIDVLDRPRQVDPHLTIALRDRQSPSSAARPPAGGGRRRPPPELPGERSGAPALRRSRSRPGRAGRVAP